MNAINRKQIITGWWYIVQFGQVEHVNASLLLVWLWPSIPIMRCPPAWFRTSSPIIRCPPTWLWPSSPSRDVLQIWLFITKWPPDVAPITPKPHTDNVKVQKTCLPTYPTSIGYRQQTDLSLRSENPISDHSDIETIKSIVTATLMWVPFMHVSTMHSNTCYELPAHCCHTLNLNTLHISEVQRANMKELARYIFGTSPCIGRQCLGVIVRSLTR